MKRKMYLFVFSCLLELLSFTGSAQGQLANWNFDYEYATSSSGGITYYTPTGTAFSANPNITMDNSSFSVYPNSQIGTVTDYSFNAITQYCQFYTGYNNYTARLYFTGPNTVSDFTNASEHNNYFQFSFPTKGYDEIALHFSMASGQNNVNDYLEVVYSTDGGTTWVDAGSSHALSGWWLYQAYDVSISARDKDNVLV
ncbi:MAG: hypothetical protein Q7W54_04825, partial [Bacteroidota bacterium]|nr:hypothetical protein [Bacteroidota bacterium]